MAQVLGIVDIVWRGANLPVEKGAKLRLGGIKNNAVTYGRMTARAQEYQGSEITAKTYLAKGQSYGSVYSEGEGELQVVCDTGQIFVFADAFLLDPPEMTGGESHELKWNASNFQEILT